MSGPEAMVEFGKQNSPPLSQTANSFVQESTLQDAPEDMLEIDGRKLANLPFGIMNENKVPDGKEISMYVAPFSPSEANNPPLIPFLDQPPRSSTPVRDS